MNIPLFVNALTDAERVELWNCLKKTQSFDEKETTRHFIQNNKMTGRLMNILADHSGPNDVFTFISQINEVQFLKLRGAGQHSWKELELLLKKNLRGK